MKRSRMIKTGLVLATLILIFSVDAIARNINFKIALSNDKTPPGRQVEMNLYFFDSMDIPAPGMPYIEGLEIRYKGSVVESASESGILSGGIQVFCVSCFICNIRIYERIVSIASL